MQFITSICGFCGKEVTRRKQAASRNVRIHFCDMACKSNYQRLAKPVTKEWLHEQYVTKGRDCVSIAAEVSRDPKSVWNWLKDFGIPTRPRGANWEKTLVIGSGRANPFFGKKHDLATRSKFRANALADGRVPWGKNNPHPRLSGENSSNWKGGITPERQALYASREWRRASAIVWKRDGGTCQRCGKKREKGDAFDIHHIRGFECRELRAEPSNLVLLCESCHYWVHSKRNIKKRFIQ